MENFLYFESNLLGRRARFANGSGVPREIVLVTLDPQLLREGVVEPVAFLMDAHGRVTGKPLGKLQVEASFGQFGNTQED